MKVNMTIIFKLHKHRSWNDDAIETHTQITNVADM
jgi:hypothetical protein